MIPLAVGGTHVVAISDRGEVVTWGEDQDHHFSEKRPERLEVLDEEGEEERKEEAKGGAPPGLVIKWNNTLYNSKMVATRGPITAVIAAAPDIHAGDQLDSIRRPLQKIKDDSLAYSSLHEMFQTLVQGESPMRESHSASEADSREESKSVLREQDEAGNDEKAKFHNELVAIIKKAESEELDDLNVKRTDLQKVMLKDFGLTEKEVDLFMHEMQKRAHLSNPSDISLRVIKDCIEKARLDDGRLFIFGDIKTSAMKLRVKEIYRQMEGGPEVSCFSKLQLLYNPSSMQPITSVACGACHLLILTKDGNIYACGDSQQGALGLGHVTEDVVVPMRVEIKKHKGQRKVIMIVAGREHSMCLTHNHEVYTWGNGLKGKLGHGDELEQKFPKEVTDLHQHTPIFIAAGDSHSACITNNGKLFTWGDGQYGKLGHKGTAPEMAPRMVDELKDYEIVSVSCGAFHTLCVDKFEKVLGFGQQKGGKLGIKELDNIDTSVPNIIYGLEQVKEVVAGVWNSYAITRNQEVYSWGSTEKGMLGQQKEKSSLATCHIPKKVESLRLVQYEQVKIEAQKEATHSTRVVQVVCSFDTTFSVTDAGEVFFMGSNQQGQGGVDPKSRSMFHRPYQVKLSSYDSKIFVKMVAVGFSHVLAITSTKAIYSWGGNACGQLGNQSKADMFTPNPISFFRTIALDFCACGDDYSAVITEEGGLYMFGSQEKGRLGIGVLDEQGCETLPRKIDNSGSFPRIKYIDCGINHVLAIPDYDSEEERPDQGLWSWGLSTRGQLGHGNRETQCYPKLIKKVEKIRFKKVCCGYEHSMALTEHGKLYYWGNQAYFLRSELSAMEDKEEPEMMQVASIDKIKDVACNYYFNIALSEKDDGFYWGHFFQDSSKKKKKSTEIVIESKLDVTAKQIACGPNHAAIVRHNGCLYTWGFSSCGVLGLSSSLQKVPKPELVLALKMIFDKNAKNLQSEASSVAMPKLDRVAEKAAVEEVKAQDIEIEEKDEEKEDEAEEDDNLKRVQMGFQISHLSEATSIIALQKALKNPKALTQDKLGEKQRVIAKEFERVLGLFAKLKSLTVSHESKKQSVVINLINRLENGPFKQKRKCHLLIKPHKAIKENKKSLKGIFKAIFLHPCYLYTMWRKNLVDNLTMASLLKSFYGPTADLKHTKLLLMNLGCMVFKAEFENCKGKMELVDKNRLSYNPTIFSQIFDLIFMHEADCKRYAAGFSAICFNEMYRVIQQKFPEDVQNCFREMSGTHKLEASQKHIEGKLKARCESIKNILEKIRNKLIDGIGPDKQPGSIFVSEESGLRLSNTMRKLVTKCGKIARQGLEKYNRKESMDLDVAKMLLPLIIKHSCHILRNVDLLLLYNTCDKNKKDIVQDEVKKHRQNAQVLADVLMSYVTTTKAFPQISSFRMVIEFNKELEATHDRLAEILGRMITGISKEELLRTFIKYNGNIENTVISLPIATIKKLTGVLKDNFADLTIVRPIDNDPIYKNAKDIKWRLLSKLRESDEIVNFRMMTYPLQEHQSLTVCTQCKTFLTDQLAGPSSKMFIQDIQRVDKETAASLYESILLSADEILPTEADDDPVNKIKDQADKKGDYEMTEMCEKLLATMKQGKEDMKTQLELANKQAVVEYNKRVDKDKELEKNRVEIAGFDKHITKLIRKFTEDNEESMNKIISNIQYGLANRDLEQLADAVQGLGQVQAAITHINSLEISNELFEHLKKKEKKKLVPFVKKTIKELMSKGVIEEIHIPEIEEIKKDCCLILIQNGNELEIQVVYQFNKDPWCGSVSEEVEVKLFGYRMPIRKAFELFKSGHKHSPLASRKMYIESEKDKIICFNLEKFVMFYGETLQQSFSYIHRTKEEKKL